VNETGSAKGTRQSKDGAFEKFGGDFALDDFLQGDVRAAHAGLDLDEGGTPLIELFHSAGNQIDQDGRFGDDFGRSFD